MQQKQKTAWILAGGAARTVYTAGSLYALCQMDIPKPDILIACSGSAATSLCYVTGQHETIKNVWCRSLSTKKFVNFFRFWKVINIDYLIDVVLKKNNPLDMNKVRASSIKIFFPLTNSDTGEVEYYTNKSNFDLWEILRAAKSVPYFTKLFHPKGVKLGKTYYSDSIASTRFQIHVKKAVELGAIKILILDSWHSGDQPTRMLFSRLLAYMRNKRFRKTQSGYIFKIRNHSAPAGISMMYILPKEKLNMSPWEIDNKNANEVFERGYKDIIKDQALKDFLNY